MYSDWCTVSRIFQVICFLVFICLCSFVLFNLFCKLLTIVSSDLMITDAARRRSAGQHVGSRTKTEDVLV